MRPTLLPTPSTGVSAPASQPLTEGSPPGAPMHGASATIDPHALGPAIARAAARLTQLQDADGFWCFHLEADASITAEYILMMHFMDEIEGPLEAKLAAYLREKQDRAEHRGWGLFPGSGFDLSCSVKAYYALKL